MYPISVPTPAFIATLLTYGITLLLYRRALVRHGLRPALFAGAPTDSIVGAVGQEGAMWMTALFSRQPLRELELYRLVSLLLMAAMVATLSWSVLVG